MINVVETVLKVMHKILAPFRVDAPVEPTAVLSEESTEESTMESSVAISVEPKENAPDKSKNLDSSLWMMLAFAVPYTCLAVYFGYDSAQRVYAPMFMGLAAGCFAYYWFAGKMREELGKKHYWAAAVFSTVTAAVSMAVYYTGTDDFSMILAVVVSVPVIYNIFSLARLTVASGGQSVQKYVMGMIAVPFSIYVLVFISAQINAASIVIVCLACVFYAMIYMLIHIFYIEWKRATGASLLITRIKHERAITFALGLFLPVTGLMLNELLGQWNSSRGGGLFGDFSSIIFYLIAIANGALLLVPAQKNENLRLLLFYLKSAGYAYILYFFVVFLPILPIGVFALLVVIGIFAFAPMLITFWQGMLLWREYTALRRYFRKAFLAFVFVAGLVTLPLGLYAGVHSDRNNLEIAVMYLSNIPDAWPSSPAQFAGRPGSDAREGAAARYIPVDLHALRRSLDIVESVYFTTSLRGGVMETSFTKGNIPFLSRLYEEYIMSDQIISIENIQRLRHIFFNEVMMRRTENMAWQNGEQPVTLTKATADTVYDKKIEAYRTWIDLELTNGAWGFTEYRTLFNLPQGVYISDYYLNVFDEKKMGLLTDQRAAVFIFNKIVSKAQDPGMLRYTGEGTVELRVFPFAPEEVRKTGFELIHKQSFTCKLDGKRLEIGGDDSFAAVSVSGATLLSAAAIEKLPALDRSPRYCFVIDCASESDTKALEDEVLAYTTQKGLDADIYYASYTVKRGALPDIGRAGMKNEGGFNLNLAVKTIFDDTAPDAYPIIIAVTDNMPAAVWPAHTQAALFPESPYYYALNHDFTLTPYSFVDQEKQKKVDAPLIADAASFNGTAVRRDGQAQLVVTGDLPEDMTDNQYSNALLLHAEHIRNSRSGALNEVSHIRRSFRAHVMTPSTAFIVVETDEQERELLAVQQKLLNGTYAEETNAVRSLSEPPMAVFVIIAGLLLVWRKMFSAFSIEHIRFLHFARKGCSKGD